MFLDFRVLGARWISILLLEFVGRLGMATQTNLLPGVLNTNYQNLNYQ